MNEKDKVKTYQFKAGTFHCDITGHLFVEQLGSMLLDSADYFAKEGGFGIQDLNQNQHSWYISRLAIEMNDMPKAHDDFLIETWVENVIKAFSSRNYCVKPIGGEPFGYVRSIWATVNTTTKQPVDVSSAGNGVVERYALPDKPCPIRKISRVHIQGDIPYVSSIITNYSDLDINGHFNSIKYIQHMLDLWDKDWYIEKQFKRIDIVYTAEAYFGEKLNFHRQEIDENTYRIRITKQLSDNNGDEKEICRAEICFKERL